MYLKSSNKFKMKNRRQRLNPLRIFILLVLISAGVYINQVVVPTVPPPFVPTPTVTRSPESYVTDAAQLVSEGKLFQAVESYKKAVGADPTNAGNYVALSRQQIYLGLYDDALDNLGKALLVNENNPMAYALRGWALGFKGDFLNAIADLRRSIELDPNNAVPYAYLAEVYGLQYESNPAIVGVIDEALANATKAKDLDPNSLETNRARGYIQWLIGNYGEAVQFYAAAISINPYISDLHLALGIVYSTDTVNEYPLAVQEFQEAELLNPSNPLPDYQLSVVYQKLGEYATAIQYAEKTIENDPENTYYYGNLGTLYFRNENYQRAGEILALVIHGGTSESGVVVEPLPLDYGVVASYFARYGISQAINGECGEALQISQALMDSVSSDENNVYNANEIVNICTELAGSAGSEPTTEPTTELTPVN
jgi:tetratricopeptide (TPR) repeat protein